jgi:hypothetical protein
MVPDEVVIELPNTTPQRTIAAIRRRFRLTALESRRDDLLGTTFYRWRIPDRRSVAAVIRALDGERRIASAQPNYLFTLQQTAEAKPEQAGPATAAAAAAKPAEGDPAQYAVSRMHLPEAHAIAKGDNVLVAVIDSGVDASQPELAGSIADTFDTLSTPFAPHAHGTAIAALIAGHNRLMGSAPGARILAVRAFDPAGNTAEATTFNIMKGIDWAVAHHARIINMSFAGPADPAIHRGLLAAQERRRADRRRRQCRAEIAAALSRGRARGDRRHRDRLVRQAVRRCQSRPPDRRRGAGRRHPDRGAERRLRDVDRHLLFVRRGQRHRRTDAAT